MKLTFNDYQLTNKPINQLTTNLLDKPNFTEAHLKDMDSFFYGGNGWQAGLFQLVEDLKMEQAVWIPAEGRNSIWKIIKHVIFWKYAILERAKGKPLTSDQRREGDWRNIPEDPTEEKWQDEIRDLKKTHEEFKEFIKNYGSELFNMNNDESNYIRENLLHDPYHAGQIGLLRVLQGIPPIKY